MDAESALWGWTCEALEFDSPLDIDALIGADDIAVDDGQRARRGDGNSRRKQVCKHWLRGLCMKGEQCDYLHIYDPARMPVCHFYATFGECSNKDCIFAHREVDGKSDECAWYNRGFCKLGAGCRLKHVRKQPCPLYLQGFCPSGPACEFGHPKFELPDLDDEHRTVPDQQRMGRPMDNITCFKCWRKGHFSTMCQGKRIPQPPAHMLAARQSQIRSEACDF